MGSLNMVAAMIDVEESTFDIFLRYGLFFGAVFQLICIGAAIFGPDSSESNLKVRFIKTNIMYFLFTKINFLNNRRTTVRTRGQNRAAYNNQLETNFEKQLLIFRLIKYGWLC